MKNSFKKLFTSLFTLAFIITTPFAWGADTLLMNGAGATFPYPLYSKWFYEYQKVPPLLSPIAEWLWVLPSKLLSVSVINYSLLMKFFLPTLLFLLVYFFIIEILNSDFLHTKFFAIAGSFLVVLGYDLVDYRTVFNVIRGTHTLSSFLIWTRPVNPINGAIIIFSFLFILLLLLKKITVGRIITGVCLFSLAVYTYFFTWALLLSITSILIVVYFFKKKWPFLKAMLIILGLGFLISLPYFYLVNLASKNVWYADSAARIGLHYSHQPIINKLLLLVIILFLALTIILKKHKYFHDDWWWFCLALLFGGVWAFSQQIITGISIWPYHF